MSSAANFLFVSSERNLILSKTKISPLLRFFIAFIATGPIISGINVTLLFICFLSRSVCEDKEIKSFL